MALIGLRRKKHFLTFNFLATILAWNNSCAHTPNSVRISQKEFREILNGGLNKIAPKHCKQPDPYCWVHEYEFSALTYFKTKPIGYSLGSANNSTGNYISPGPEKSMQFEMSPVNEPYLLKNGSKTKGYLRDCGLNCRLFHFEVLCGNECINDVYVVVGEAGTAMEDIRKKHKKIWDRFFNTIEKAKK